MSNNATTNHQLRMKDVCDITSSKRIFAADYTAEGVPFYRGKEIIEKHKGNLNVSTELFIAESKFAEIEAKFGAPTAGDILLTSVGTLGVPYVVRPGERFYFKDGNLTWFRNLREIHPLFLYYWLLAPQGRAELEKCRIGSSQPAFTIVLLKNMEIRLPSLALQRTIAAILSAYDDLIENNTRRIAILEEMARALYREWFVDFRFPDHTNTARKKTPLGSIPSTWKIQTTAETFQYVGGSTPSKDVEEYWKDGTIEWFTPTDLTRNKSLFIESSALRITPTGLEKSSTKMFPPYCTMMTSRATIGVTAINTRPACTNQGFITCIPSPQYPLYLLYYWLQHNIDYFISIGTGSTFKELTRTAFRAVPVLVPPTELASRFQLLVEPIGKQVLLLQRKNANLRATRDLLLPKLISGELDVSRLPDPGAIA